MRLLERKINSTQFKNKKGQWKNNSSMYLIKKKRNFQSINKQPRYFAYILKWDSGLAPNPFHKFCTLAVCKPYIRKIAKEGDWIIGLGSKNQNDLKLNYQGHLIYAMEVTKKVTFDDYWKDEKFIKNRQKADSPKGRCGDNMYYKNSNGSWVQKTYEAHNSLDNRIRDTSVDAVLISKNFFYLGKKHINIPSYIKDSINKSWQQKKYKTLIDKPWRNYRYLDERSGKLLVKWLKKKYKRKGRHSNPVGYEADNKRCDKKNKYKISSPNKSCGY